MSRFMKLKARYYLIMFLCMLIVDVLVVLYTFKFANKTINMILLIVSFLITGLFFDLFINKVFSKNALKNLYKEKSFSIEDINFESKLSSYTKRDYSYGNVYSKVEGKYLYKISIIKNLDEYRSFDDSNDNSNPTPGIDNASRLIGLEFFLVSDDKLIEDIRDFCISNEKIYYQTFYLKNEKLINANYLEPYTMHEEKYKKLLEELGIKDEENTDL